MDLLSSFIKMNLKSSNFLSKQLNNKISHLKTKICPQKCMFSLELFKYFNSSREVLYNFPWNPVTMIKIGVLIILTSTAEISETKLEHTTEKLARQIVN